MEVKSKGIEFEVRSPNNRRQLGDLYLTKTGLTWCKGRTARENGKRMSWNEFVQMMKVR